jgi:hypothetical protein
LAGVLGLPGTDRECRTQIEVNLVRHREPPRQMRFARKTGKVEVNYFTPAQRTSRNFQRCTPLPEREIFMNIEPIEEIIQRLKKYPDLRYQNSDSSITIEPKEASNFEVSFAVNGPNNFTVSFEGWHETFDSKEEAQNCFAMGLANQCRLSVFSKGTFPYKWQLETLDEGTWQSDSEVGLFLFPFWRNTIHTVKQNDYLSKKI